MHYNDTINHILIRIIKMHQNLTAEDQEFVNGEVLSSIYFATKAKNRNTHRVTKPELTEKGRETLDYLRRLLELDNKHGTQT